jgi:hypothetical protein
MFLGHACRLKARVKQLDFVGAFLQAKMRTRMFVTIPKIFVILFPEYAWCTGKPVRLLMSMYGTTLSGKYWYLALLDFLKEIGFTEGDCVKCSFIKVFADGSKLFLLNYVDDMLYYGTSLSKLQDFEKQLGERFQLELLGNAHWYLGSRINQLKNFDIELDQSRYCRPLLKNIWTLQDALRSSGIMTHHYLQNSLQQPTTAHPPRKKVRSYLRDSMLILPRVLGLRFT